MDRKLLQIMVVLLHKPVVYNLNILLCKFHDFVCSRNGKIKSESAAVAIFQISLAHPVFSVEQKILNSATEGLIKPIWYYVSHTEIA